MAPHFVVDFNSNNDQSWPRQFCRSSNMHSALRPHSLPAFPMCKASMFLDVEAVVSGCPQPAPFSRT